MTKETDLHMRITAITMVRNMAGTIEQTIKSVLGQDYDDLEYIVMDGGSTDGTADIIRRYDNKIAYWVSEPDGGTADALNKALKHATGDVICIVNGDDYWADNQVAGKVAETFLSTGADAVHGLVREVDDDGNELRVNDGSAGNIIFAWPILFIKRELFDKYGGMDTSYRFTDDWELCIRMHYHGWRTALVNHVCTCFRKSGVSSNHSRDWRIMKEIRRMITYWEPKFKEKGRNIDVIKGFDIYYHRQGIINFLSRRMKKTKKRMAARLLQRNGKQKIVIVGLDRADDCLEWLEEDKKKVFACLTDNKKFLLDGNKQYMLSGVPIMPAKLDLLKGKSFIIVATKDSKETQKILEDVGLRHGKDFLSLYEYQRKEINFYLQQNLGLYGFDIGETNLLVKN